MVGLVVARLGWMRDEPSEEDRRFKIVVVVSWELVDWKEQQVGGHVAGQVQAAGPAPASRS